MIIDRPAQHLWTEWHKKQSMRVQHMLLWGSEQQAVHHRIVSCWWKQHRCRLRKCWESYNERIMWLVPRFCVGKRSSNIWRFDRSWQIRDHSLLYGRDHSLLQEVMCISITLDKKIQQFLAIHPPVLIGFNGEIWLSNSCQFFNSSKVF
jgi:hypothetical protein